MPGSLTGTRDDQLQHRRCAVVERRLGDERLGRVLKGPTDSDRPLPFEARDEIWEIIDPLLGASRERLVAHDRGDLDDQGL